MPYGQPLYPVNLGIPVSQIKDALGCDINNPQGDPLVVGLCFKLQSPSRDPYLSIWKVIWNGQNPIIDTMLRVEVVINLTLEENDFEFGPSSERVLHAHIDQDTIRDGYEIPPPLIYEFRFVFIDKDTLLYYCDRNKFSSGIIYVSRAVTQFFEGENTWKNYRTLKFSPFAFPVTAIGSENRDSVAYYVAPSCPPTWKHTMDVVGYKKFDKSSNKYEFFQIPIYSHELITAFEKAGETTTQVASNNGNGIPGFRKFTSKDLSRLKEIMFFYRKQ